MKKRIIPAAISLAAATFAYSAAFVAETATAGSAGGPPARPVAEPAKPNILFIMADDHGRNAVSCYNPQSLIQTPNIDRLAKEGIRFDAAFANNSICSPSRAVLLTGKYNHLCGVRKLNDVFDGTQQTFPKLLQKAGYQTAIVGKWHLLSEPTGFDYYSVLPGHGCFYDCPMKSIGKPWGNGNSGGIPQKGYLTDVITDLSLKWLERRDPDKPFCLMIHHKAPHGPHDPAPRHKDLFKGTTFPEPSNLLDDHAGRAPEPVAEKLIWSRLLQNNYPEYKHLHKQFTGDRAHDTRLMYQAFMKGYLRLIAGLDENIGRTLDYLDKSGLAKNTVVIYVSDNGFFNGEHGFYNKMWMYEEGFSLPLLVRMPPGFTSRKPGSTCNELVGMFDMAPTILDLAGANIPADIQGASLKPLVEGKTAPWRDAFYYHYYGSAGSNAQNSNNWIAWHEVIGVRTHTAKLIFYPKWKNGPFWEYFDLATDPQEMKNLIADPARQADIAAAKKQLRTLAQQHQDTETVKMLDATPGPKQNNDVPVKIVK